MSATACFCLLLLAVNRFCLLLFFSFVCCLFALLVAACYLVSIWSLLLASLVSNHGNGFGFVRGSIDRSVCSALCTGDLHFVCLNCLLRLHSLLFSDLDNMWLLLCFPHSIVRCVFSRSCGSHIVLFRSWCCWLLNHVVCFCPLRRFCFWLCVLPVHTMLVFFSCGLLVVCSAPFCLVRCRLVLAFCGFRLCYDGVRLSVCRPLRLCLLLVSCCDCMWLVFWLSMLFGCPSMHFVFAMFSYAFGCWCRLTRSMALLVSVDLIQPQQNGI